MRGLNWLRKKLLKRSRHSYNSKRFRTSRRRAFFTYFFFRDQESLDILARSRMRLRNYASASRAYRLADSKGMSLLDHKKNHFTSEIRTLNHIEAFAILLSTRNTSERKSMTKDLCHSLGKLMDAERVQTIQEMSELGNLPLEVAELLPWSTKKTQISSESEDSFSLQSDGSRDAERYVRELSRIKSSSAFRVLDHVSSSARSPLRLLTLPFTLPSLIFNLISQRKGISSEQREIRPRLMSQEPRRECIVFFPTNGVGFGHFTRCLAVARQIRKESPDTEVVFFTTMPTLQILSEEGIISYHMPSRYRYGDMLPKVWNSLCEEMLNLVFDLHRPKAFVFDGSFPYRGMLNSISTEGNSMMKIWLRRGAIKRGSRNIPVESIGLFNAIIRPGDSVEINFDEEMKHNIPIFKTEPILLEHKGEGIDIRSRFGIPAESTLCYVQLGAGMINDIDSEISITLKALSEHPGLYVIIGESMIGERIPVVSGFERIRILRDYPNSQYFSEFDFAIIAGGYNTFHEVISTCLPSICYPNLETKRDDQLARTRLAESNGSMIVLPNRGENNVRISISRMMDRQVRGEMRANIAKSQRQNGAGEAAKWILSQISQKDPANKK